MTDNARIRENTRPAENLANGRHPSTARPEWQPTRANEFRLVSRWQVEGTVEEVTEILEDGPGLPRWWPAVYRSVEQLRPNDERGVGGAIRLRSKGWLPYTMSWEFQVTENRRPHGMTLRATGDLSGEGIWTLEQLGTNVGVTYEWRVRVEMPIIGRLSFLLRPVLAANHNWAMAKGLASLKLELARRHARTPEERSRVPAPPGPSSTPASLLSLLGVVGLALASYRLVRGARRRIGG